MKLYRERTTKDFLWALVLHSGKLCTPAESRMNAP